MWLRWNFHWGDVRLFHENEKFLKLLQFHEKTMRVPGYSSFLLSRDTFFLLTNQNAFYLIYNLLSS